MVKTAKRTGYSGSRALRMDLGGSGLGGIAITGFELSPLAERHYVHGGQAGLDPDRLIFIDESGLSTKMARLRGWAPKGERCLAAIPHGLWKTITFAGGLTLSGFVAPMLLDGPMDGECFRAWVDRGQGRHTPLPAAPGLRRGRLYSPGCNPIETAFAKLKAHVRKAAARNFNAPEQAAAHALTKFDPNQCTNFLVHAGYGLD